MKIIAVNGSPRKEWNTARLLAKTLEGAAHEGMDTKLVHLYDLDYKGCISCFACKLPGGVSYGRCVMQDGLTPILNEIRDADAIVVGSPVYFFDATGEARSFLERLLFQSLVYTNPPSSIFPRTIKTSLIYTMNVAQEISDAMGLTNYLEVGRSMMERTFGHCEMLTCTDTLQFKDYSKYEIAYFDPESKKRRHQEVFPKDLERAYALGRRLAEVS